MSEPGYNEYPPYARGYRYVRGVFDVPGEPVEIYAGGTCRDNSGPGGWGVLLRHGRHEKEICGGDAAVTTANRMALTATIMALESLTRSCVVRIHTDNSSVRDGVTKRNANGFPIRGDVSAADNDLLRQLDTAMEPHDVSLHWLKDRAGNPDNERACRLASKGLRQAIADAAAHRAAADDGECKHEMPIGWCALCRPPRPGVLPRGYRTAAGRAYHNDPDCTWMHRGQRQATRQGKNIHDVVRVAWADVRPGELEPCESCCTPHWLKRHGH